MSKGMVDIILFNAQVASGRSFLTLPVVEGLWDRCAAAVHEAPGFGVCLHPVLQLIINKKLLHARADAQGEPGSAVPPLRWCGMLWLPLLVYLATVVYDLTVWT